MRRLHALAKRTGLPQAILQRNQTRPGAALLVATLVATLLATAAVVLMLGTRSARAAASEAQRIEQARMQADALVAAAIVALDSGTGLPALNDSAMTLPDAAGVGRVRVQDAAGLVDLNAASPDRLAALFAALGIEAARARELADRIADWRDEDDLKHAAGAETREYEAAGLSPPGNRPFVVEAEMAGVMGVTDALARCTLPFLTVHSGLGEIDPAAAPEIVRSAMGAPAPPLGASGAGAPLGRVLIVTGEAPLSESAVLRARRWIRLTGNPTRPVFTHRAQVELAPAGGAQAPSCPTLEDAA